MSDAQIRTGDPLEDGAKKLLNASHALMESMFPSEANHYLSFEALRAPHIQFFVAEENDEMLGCVALAAFEDYGEIKSMFVAPEGRGKGVAASLLEHLIAKARTDGLGRLMLETGTGLDAAHRLYERHKFTDRDAFGGYLDDAPFSRYMELAL
jgi:putative acetyltransferase